MKNVSILYFSQPNNTKEIRKFQNAAENVLNADFNSSEKVTIFLYSEL